MKYREVKIRVNPENSAAAQEKLFEDNCYWVLMGKNFYALSAQYIFVTMDGHMTCASDDDYFNGHHYKEIKADDALKTKPKHKYAEILEGMIRGESIEIFDPVTKRWIQKTHFDIFERMSEDVDTEWLRVKPKTKTIKQWERKYISKRGFVVTVHSAQKPDWNENWIGEAYQSKYEVQNN